MTSTTTRIIITALTILSLSVPVAGAMPLRDDGTAAPKQDLRNPDQQAPAPRPYQDLRNPDQRFPTSPVFGPLPVVHTQPVADDSGPSPLVYILPALGLLAMLSAAVIYTRSARPARV